MTTRRQLLVVGSAWLTVVVAATFAITSMTAPIHAAPHPEPLPSAQSDGRRFGMTLDERRALFDALVENEPRYRARAATNFANHAFSINDDRSHGEMRDARRLARERHLSLSQVYLVLDEGIRKGWPGPDGEPLETTVPPLDPRR